MAVEEIMVNLKDQMNKLKVEELAIRASIRTRMKESQVHTADLNNPEEFNQTSDSTFCARMQSTASNQMNVLPSTSSNEAALQSSGATIQAGKQNAPIEVSINEALDMIRRYRERDPLQPEGDVMGAFSEDSAEFDDTVEAASDEETEYDEPSVRTLNPDMEFLDLRTEQPDEDDA